MLLVFVTMFNHTYCELSKSTKRTLIVSKSASFSASSFLVGTLDYGQNGFHKAPTCSLLRVIGHMNFHVSCRIFEDSTKLGAEFLFLVVYI